MNITKSCFTDENNYIKSVVLDYHTYQKLEQLLLDEETLCEMPVGPNKISGLRRKNGVSHNV